MTKVGTMLQAQTLVTIRIWEVISKCSFTIFLRAGMSSGKNILTRTCWKTPGALNTPVTLLPPYTPPQGRLCVWYCKTQHVHPPLWTSAVHWMSPCIERKGGFADGAFSITGVGVALAWTATIVVSHHCLRYAGWRHLAMSHAAGSCRVGVNCGLAALGAASGRPVLIGSCVLWFMSLDLHPPRPSLPALHSSVDSDITRTLSNTRRQKRSIWGNFSKNVIAYLNRFFLVVLCVNRTFWHLWDKIYQVLHIYGLYIHQFNRTQMENIQENFLHVLSIVISP